MINNRTEHRKGMLIAGIAIILGAAVATGAVIAYFIMRKSAMGVSFSVVVCALIPLVAYTLYRKLIFPYYHRLEDANLELHLKQEELLDTKDDLFIKFLGIYDVNHAANSPRLFVNRMKDVADITARVMEADVCLVYLYEKKTDELALEATNKERVEEVKNVRIPLGQGIEGWVGRKLEPVMLKDFRSDPRFKDVPELKLSHFQSVYCLPLYVYSNGSLMGVMELLFSKARNFTDEEINFFTTLSGIIATTVQNEQMQVELRKMNLELEQWVSEKTEELRASEERYRTLVENASESIFVLAGNGDIVFANEQAVRLTGCAKYDLLHKNLFDFFVDAREPKELLTDVEQGHQAIRQGDLRKIGGDIVPVEVSAVGLALMGKRFLQAVVRDMTARVRLEKLLEEKDKEIESLRSIR